MPNLRIVPENWVDEMTLSGSDVTTMPVEHLQSVARGRVWRSETLSTGGGGVREISGDLGSGVVRDANCFFIFRHNLAGGTIRLRLYDSGSSLVYDSGTNTFSPAIVGAHSFGGLRGSFLTDPFYQQAPYMLYFPVWEFKTFTLSLGGTLASGDVYAQASRIFLGKYFEVGINPDYGVALGMETTTDQVRTRGGSLRSSRGESWRTFTADLNRMSEADRSVWLDLMRICGLERDFVISLFPTDATREERDYCMDGKFVSLDPLTYQVSWRTKRLQVKEV